MTRHVLSHRCVYSPTGTHTVTIMDGQIMSIGCSWREQQRQIALEQLSGNEPMQQCCHQWLRLWRNKIRCPLAQDMTSEIFAEGVHSWQKRHPPVPHGKPPKIDICSWNKRMTLIDRAIAARGLPHIPRPRMLLTLYQDTTGLTLVSSTLIRAMGGLVLRGRSNDNAFIPMAWTSNQRLVGFWLIDNMWRIERIEHNMWSVERIEHNIKYLEPAFAPWCRSTHA